MKKICPKCNILKSINNFRRLKNNNFYSYCFDCASKYKKMYMINLKKDPNRLKKLKDQEKKYRSNRKDKQKIYFKSWYEKNKYKRNYHENNIIIKEWALKNPEKIKAQSLVNTAIKSGKIKRKKNCEVCNVSCKTHAHHENYLKPYDVVFLCGSCHKKIHLGILKLSTLKNNKC